MARMEILGNQFTKPHWLADFSVGQSRVLPVPGKLDRASFNNYYGVDVQVAAPASAAATSITVAAINLPLPSVNLLSSTGVRIIPQGSIIIFDNATGKMARLSADALQGDTTLTVYPIPVALGGTEDAKWDAYNITFVPSGILVGRTTWGTGLWEPGAPLTQQELALTFYDTPDLIRDNNCEFLRPNMGTAIKVNYLPQYSLMTADPGIANPTVAPVLTQTGTDGSFGVGTYFFGYSYGNAYGETLLSPLASISVGATEHVHIADLGAFPTHATYIKFYAGAAIADVNVQMAAVLNTHGATDILAPGSGKGPSLVNNTQSGFGQQLDWLQNHCNLILGVN